jgi:hypothetical protein
MDSAPKSICYPNSLDKEGTSASRWSRMVEELNELLKSYLESQTADGYLFSGPISTRTADEVVSVIERQEDRRPNVCFFLTTGGGDPHCAYRIGRTLKRYYETGKIIFLFGGYCKSAGTLLALCASELVFSTFGELGPLERASDEGNGQDGAVCQRTEDCQCGANSAANVLRDPVERSRTFLTI